MTGEAVLSIAGPTATGKTALAVCLAELLGGEVISADSRQAYLGLAVGTAAPAADEMRGVPHHGVGFLDPGERYGAGRFARYARDWMDQIRGRGREPILSGGTGLFFRGLSAPVFAEPPMDVRRRALVGRWLDQRPAAELERWMRVLDPAAAERLARVDPQRAARALEVALLTGRRLSDWQSTGRSETSPIALAMYVLELDPEMHRARIAARAVRMFDPWLAEVRDLLDRGLEPGSPALTSIGYRTIVGVIEMRVSREEALEAIIRDTWQYARRQRTWFRHQAPPDAVRLDARMPTEELVSKINRDREKRAMR